MGVVYQALDRERQLRVALKTLHTFTADTILRFKDEFRALQDLQHPNILVNREGRLVVLDFGLATDVGGHPWSEVDVVGTADYMAPEQATSKPAGPAADCYSVGVLLYEALTGRLPHSGGALEVLIH